MSDANDTCTTSTEREEWPCRYTEGSERAHGFSRGVNRVQFHRACHGFMPAGVGHPVTRAPKSIRKHWGPSRRHAPHGAHSTPAPATREGVTARPIQPRRHVSLPTVAERAGRPMARPVRSRPRTAGASPTPRRALCKEIPRPCRDAQHATPLAGLTYRARTRVRPRGGSLPPSDGTDPTPSVRNPTTSVVGGCQCEETFSGDAYRRQHERKAHRRKRDRDWLFSGQQSADMETGDSEVSDS